MAKLTIASLRLTMRRLAEDGDTESYDELWHSIDVLANLGLIDQRMKHAMAAEDDRLFQTIEEDAEEDDTP